jgi:hypothetical protein
MGGSGHETTPSGGNAGLAGLNAPSLFHMIAADGMMIFPDPMRLCTPPEELLPVVRPAFWTLTQFSPIAHAGLIDSP